MSLSAVQELYPEMTYTDSKGKQRMERGNKYFIMFGDTGDAEGVSLAERRYVSSKDLDNFLNSNFFLKITPPPTNAHEAFMAVTI